MTVLLGSVSTAAIPDILGRSLSNLVLKTAQACAVEFRRSDVRPALCGL